MSSNLQPQYLSWPGSLNTCRSRARSTPAVARLAHSHFLDVKRLRLREALKVNHRRLSLKVGAVRVAKSERLVHRLAELFAVAVVRQMGRQAGHDRCGGKGGGGGGATAR